MAYTILNSKNHYSRVIFYLVLATLTLCALFNYGFMQLKIGSNLRGIPVYYFVTFCLMPFTLMKISQMRTVAKTYAGLIFTIWFIYGLGRVLVSAGSDVYWVLRDASYLWDSVWVLFGCIACGALHGSELIHRWIKYVCYGLLAIVLMYIFRTSLVDYVPKVAGSQGQEVPLLLTNQNSSFMLLVCAAYLWICDPYKRLKIFRNFNYLAVFLFVFALCLFPSRSMVLQAALLVPTAVYFSKYFKQVSSKKIIYAFSLLALLIMFSGLFGLSSLGRYSDRNYSLSAIGQLLIESVPGRESVYSSGWERRLEWWTTIIEKSKESVPSFLFGHGYGSPLIDFVAEGKPYGSVVDYQSVVVREPHNDYLTLYARSGFIGLALFLILQTIIALKAFRIVKSRMPWDVRALAVFYLIYASSMYLFMMGETALTQSYFVIPFYFMQGMIIRYSVFGCGILNKMIHPAAQEACGDSPR